MKRRWRTSLQTEEARDSCRSGLITEWVGTSALLTVCGGKEKKRRVKEKIVFRKHEVVNIHSKYIDAKI